MMSLENNNKKLSKETILKELWYRGELSYLLDSVQKELYYKFYNSKNKIQTWLLARRNGKSFLLCILAIEQCLRKPNSIVKFIAPTKIQVDNIIRPIIRQILQDCPENIKPEPKKQQYIYYFPNGSEIQLAGSDSGHAEKLRGGNSDLFFIDEAGSCSGLNYLINDILLPTTLITKGRGILASTPPSDSDHDFVGRIEDAEHKGTLVKKTIFDNPRISKEQLDELITELGGIHTEAARRELMCVDENTLIKTKNGYKYIKNINIGEEVFTHEGRYKKVLNKFLNPLKNRKVYNIQSSNNLELICTEGHQLYTAITNYKKLDDGYINKWIKVEDINLNHPTKRSYFKVPIDKNLSVNDYPLELISLIGWHIAEGHINKKTQTCILSLNYNDPIEKINEYSMKIWGKCYKNYVESQGCKQYVLCSKKAKEFFKQFGEGAKNKFIPYDLKTSSYDKKVTLLKSLFEGDGYYNLEQKRAGYSSISLRLIGDISDILNSIDIPHQIQSCHEEGPSEILGRKVYIQDSYNINIFGLNFDKFIKEIHNLESLQKSNRSRHLIRDGFLFSRIHKINLIENYNKDIVYDIEVEEDHSYVGLHSVFHNCELIKDPQTSVIPEFTSDLEKEIIKEWPEPPFYDSYVSMDLGGKDLTALLFAYYDFRSGKVIVLDELIVNFQDKGNNLETLTQQILEKENKLFLNTLTNEVRKPYIRVSDIDYLVTQEITHKSKGQLYFKPADKYDNDFAINNMRLMIGNKKVVIHPRCKTLITHLRNVKWDKSRRKFSRSPDHSHYDAVEALKYLLRTIQYTKNPYPASYGFNPTDLYINKPEKFPTHPNRQVDVFKKIFGFTNKRKF